MKCVKLNKFTIAAPCGLTKQHSRMYRGIGWKIWKNYSSFGYWRSRQPAAMDENKIDHAVYFIFQ